MRQIIQILVWEDKAKPGEIKRSTLQDRLTARGYSSRQMRMYTSQGVAARRFQKQHRNALWQSDTPNWAFAFSLPDLSLQKVTSLEQLNTWFQSMAVGMPSE